MAKMFKSREGEMRLLESYDKVLRVWNVPYREQAIPTRFGETHLVSAGESDRPPLLLFHGIGDNSALMWVRNAKELAKHFYVIAVDALGAPGKSRPNGEYDRGFDSTAWIDDILDHLKLDHVHMAGVSHGATFILRYAMQRPERSQRLVCMAGAFPVKGWVSRLRMLKSVTVFMPEMFAPNERNAARLLRKLSGPDFDPLGEPAIFEHFLLLLKHGIPPRRKLIDFLPEDFAPLRERALFLIGQQDPVAYHPPMLRFLESQRLRAKIVPHAGHMLNDEKADLVNREIVQFLMTP